MSFLKQTTNKFLALGAFLLASVGICIASGMVYAFIRVMWEEMSKAPSLDWTSWFVASIILVILILVTTLIANIPKLIKFGINKIKNENDNKHLLRR